MSEVIVKMTSDYIKVKGGEYVRDLVRCAECRHWRNEHICMAWSRYGTIETKADQFCSYGEVRDE